MRGKNISKELQRAKYVLMDFIMTSLAFLIFNCFRYYMLEIGSSYINLSSFIFSNKLLIEQATVPTGLLALFWLSGYYNHPFRKSRLVEFTTTLSSTLTATLLIFFSLLINDTTGVKLKDYELLLVLFFLLALFTYIGRRIITRRTLRHLRKRSWIYSTLIIGNSTKSRKIYNKLQNSGSVWAYNVVGFVRLDGEKNIEDDCRVWEWDEIEDVIASQNIDQIVLAPENIRDSELMGILKRLFPLNCPVKIAPDTLSYITGSIRLDDIHGIPFIDLTSPRISEFQKNAKRSIDVSFSLIAGILLSPILIIIALAVKFTSPGPVIFKQERIGHGRRPFNIYKFRSMHQNAEKNGPQLSHENDNRTTALGKIMRKYRIDELPQLWNIIKGDMSLVGPRPERAYFIDKIVKRAPYYGLIFQVRPGLTSWGMVKHGYASNVDEMVARARYDLLYLNNMSLITDFKIMIHTVNTILNGSGM
ncbi:MAG: exopolysaccharide biosynthesis polyprenyl glycosylphosphotransferase [Bacteroidales bacterium]|nr:exopolysaccharide biosynthesis polyprenyl glycosylphosphotransferase [Bacteroidales bacterium]